MIIYDLRCESDHAFEGWFRSPEDFDSQLSQRQIRCPQCDSHLVRRVPSAIAIAIHGKKIAGHETSQSISSTRPSVAAQMPTGPQVKAIYRQLVNTLLEQSEDVGTEFAKEARKIHYHEAPERLIRGQSTDDEREALRDEGIEILQLPMHCDEELN